MTDTTPTKPLDLDAIRKAWPSPDEHEEHNVIHSLADEVAHSRATGVEWASRAGRFAGALDEVHADRDAAIAQAEAAEGERDDVFAELKIVTGARDEALAKVADEWDAGYRSGHSNAMRRMSDEPNAPKTPNPHRAALPHLSPRPDAEAVASIRSLLEGVRCLDRDADGNDRCDRRAVAVPWGTLYSKDQVGPKCAEHLEVRHPHLGMWVPGPLNGPAAVLYLEDLHRLVGLEPQACTCGAVEYGDMVQHLFPCSLAPVPAPVDDREALACRLCGSGDDPTDCLGHGLCCDSCHDDARKTISDVLSEGFIRKHKDPRLANADTWFYAADVLIEAGYVKGGQAAPVVVSDAAVEAGRFETIEAICGILRRHADDESDARETGALIYEGDYAKEILALPHLTLAQREAGEG